MTANLPALLALGAVEAYRRRLPGAPQVLLAAAAAELDRDGGLYFGGADDRSRFNLGHGCRWHRRGLPDE